MDSIDPMLRPLAPNPAEVLARFAHDLRAPLHVMQGHAQLIQSDLPPASGLADAVAEILRAGQRLSCLIDAMQGQARAQAPAVRRPEIALAPAALPAAPQSTAPRTRVLVIDDDLASLQLTRRVLCAPAFDPPTLVQDARRLHQVLAAEAFDLVILDMDMPHLDGWAVLEQLHEVCGEQVPPVLVVTGDTRRNLQVRVLRAGACDYLVKPFDPGELVARAHRHVAIHRSRTALRRQKVLLESLVQERTVQLRHSQLDIAQLLGRAAEYRDNETGAHILRMSHASTLLARRLGWSDADCEQLLNASPLHDIGKIAIPDRILLKPGPLDADEWSLMQTHTTTGAAILDVADNETLRLAATIALNHHERWDGSGYPNGRAGREIPPAARIVAVADVFDALRSARPYKPAWPTERAVEHIRAQAGRHFDPEIVAVFLEAVDALETIGARFADPTVPPS